MAVFVKSSLVYDWPFNRALSRFDKSFTLIDQSIGSTDKNSRVKYTCYESYGICTYQSYSAPMYDYEILPKICDYSEGSISHYEDTYYKFIESIEYPYIAETTSSDEVLMNEILYSVHLLGRVNGRYYNNDRERSEIPLLDIVCNQQRFVTSIPEVSAVLQKAGYKLESCVDSFTNETIQCVIYEPEMEANSSSSYAEESDYIGESEWESVGESERGWNRVDDGEQQFIADAQINAENVVEEIINKIDDVNSIPSQSSSEWNTEETCTSKDTTKESSRCNSDFLDLQTNVIEIEQVVETGCKHPKIEIPSIIRKKYESSPLLKTKLEGHLKIDITKENSTTLKNGLVKDITVPKRNKDEPRNTSEDPSATVKKGKIKECVDFSGGRRSPSPDIEDVIVPSGSNVKRRKKQKRNAGECQLNRREEDDEILNERVNVDIVNAEVNLINELLDQMPQAVVENGDLVNNNRDFEGNNYPNAARDVEEIQNEDNENQNRVEHVEENEVQQDFENRNENNDRQPLRLRNEVQAVQDAGRDVGEGAEELPEVEQASREALFDPNSQLDLLDGFINPQSNREANNVHPSQNGVVVIGINPIDEDSGVAVLPTHANPFPNWLLHLLESEELGSINLHDEPHFYCQGDGIGVHPSIIEVDLEEDSDTDSDESSHSNADENLTLQTNSNSQSDMTSFLLESDSRQGTPTDLHTLPNQNSSSSNAKKDQKPDQLVQNGIRTVSSSPSDAGSSMSSLDSKSNKRLKKKVTVSDSSGFQDNKEDFDMEEIEEENFAVSLSLLSNLILASTEEVYETLRNSSSSLTTSNGVDDVSQGINIAGSSQNEGDDKDAHEKESSDPT
ncbi:protein starmaker isoform X2 [Agrilus planipennis]|uniref:Protein starmaker isoform X2 n=1 Tax=Agrilus planipennis TaxID=224129 RepID=A0A7F5R569_AGRPL|nr:protein starmaker isoform X2 [Agrilus planipennis]